MHDARRAERNRTLTLAVGAGLVLASWIVPFGILAAPACWLLAFLNRERVPELRWFALVATVGLVFVLVALASWS